MATCPRTAISEQECLPSSAMNSNYVNDLPTTCFFEGPSSYDYDEMLIRYVTICIFIAMAIWGIRFACKSVFEKLIPNWRFVPPIDSDQDSFVHHYVFTEQQHQLLYVNGSSHQLIQNIQTFDHLSAPVIITKKRAANPFASVALRNEAALKNDDLLLTSPAKIRQVESVPLSDNKKKMSYSCATHLNDQSTCSVLRLLPESLDLGALKHVLLRVTFLMCAKSQQGHKFNAADSFKIFYLIKMMTYLLPSLEDVERDRLLFAKDALTLPDSMVKLFDDFVQNITGQDWSKFLVGLHSNEVNGCPAQNTEELFELWTTLLNVRRHVEWEHAEILLESFEAVYHTVKGGLEASTPMDIERSNQKRKSTSQGGRPQKSRR